MFTRTSVQTLVNEKEKLMTSLVKRPPKSEKSLIKKLLTLGWR